MDTFGRRRAREALFRTTATTAALLVLAACSSAHPAQTMPATDADVITHPQVARAARAGASTAWDVLLWFHPGWSASGVVCVDGVPSDTNTLQTLELMSAASVNTIMTGRAVANLPECGLNVTTLQ